MQPLLLAIPPLPAPQMSTSPGSLCWSYALPTCSFEPAHKPPPHGHLQSQTTVTSLPGRHLHLAGAEPLQVTAAEMQLGSPPSLFSQQHLPKPTGPRAPSVEPQAQELALFCPFPHLLSCPASYSPSTLTALTS